MPTATFPGAPRIGRDPNDATWIVVRDPEDWEQAGLNGLIFDREAGVLELEPQLWSDGGEGERWRPTEAVADAAGNWYRSDPARHLILRKAVCAETFVPLPCIGRYGWQTGRLSTPLGLTFDHRGWLYVADSGNHRVQVVRPEDGSVVVVLGVTDGWGRPVRGTDGGAMTEPVHALVDPASCRVYIADRGAGRVHVFDRRFQYLKSFQPRSLEPPTLPPRPPGTRPLPVALALRDDGTLLILDATRPRLQHMTAEGEPLPDVAIPRAGAPLPGWRTVPVRFRSFGEVLVGPLDGRVHDQAWHRVLLDADVPAGASIELQTYASDDASEQPETVPFAPADPVPVTSGDVGETGRGRLILSDEGRWRRWRTGPYRREHPLLGMFAGDGPSATDSITLPPAAADHLRAGDTIAFESAGVVEPATVGLIAGREVTFTATGRARLYGKGSLVFLLDRDRRPLPGGPRQLLALGFPDTIDLSQAAVDGAPNTMVLPHAIAAFLRPGDRIRLDIGLDRITIAIEARAEGSIGVTLTAPLTGDFTTGSVRLIETPGRLVTKGPFGSHPPRGEEITVRDMGDPPTSAQATILLIEPDLGDEVGAVWPEPGSLGPIVTLSWSEFETGAPRATDRGRYLWVRLRLFGRADQLLAATAPATPAIRALRAIMPRHSYLRYLPAIYSRRDAREDPSGALFLERFLSLFEGRLTQFEQVYESVSRLLNAETADPDWLRFLAGWLGLVFDPSWPIERRRALVLAGAELHARRGTPRGLRRYLEIYTGRDPLLAEGFQSRPATPAVLGRGPLGCFQLGDAGCDLDAYAHRFSLVVFVGADDDTTATESGVRRIIDSVKPAHALYSLTLVRPYHRAWGQSRVGLDMVLGGGQPPPFVLQGDTPIGDPTRHPVVGVARVADARAEPRSPRGIEISQKGARIDRTLTLS